MKRTRKKRSLLAAGLLVAATGAVLSGSAGAQAAEAGQTAEVACGTSFIGQEPDGHLSKIVSEAGVISDTYRTADAVPWSLQGLYEIGGAGGGGSWSTSYLAPATDGVLRTLSVRGVEGDPVMAEQSVTVDADWRAHLMPSGTGFDFYTIEEDGDILTREVIYGSGGAVELGDPETLPVRATDTKAAGIYWIRLEDGTERDVIYASEKETGALRQIVVDPEDPASAESHTLAETGFEDFTNLKASYCGDDSISLVGVNTDTGDASWFEHAEVLSHSGSTLSTGQALGEAGQWQGWTGIG
ncbi:hypothetical protein [Streptomyces sp. NBC_01012]|uniref:hypothetical protein n=1 Tax=Streptomyces sp. NBC_01012 TaxID=2903717 RepID=UPI00386CA62F|nr:hypothetical protein OG623_05405 [Streptomyces sp. NBC_01012]